MKDTGYMKQADADYSAQRVVENVYTLEQSFIETLCQVGRTTEWGNRLAPCNHCTCYNLGAVRKCCLCGRHE